MSQAYTSQSVSRMAARERIGFSIEGKNPADSAARIHEAEDAGVRQVWMTAGGAGGADTLTTYAAVALQTSRIRLGTSIVPIYPRHPLVMAAQALAVDDLAPGRLRLGIGTSHRPNMEGNFGLTMKTPISYLREYVSVLRSTLWEGTVDYHGKSLNVKSTLPRRAQVPILVAALGEKAFWTAGEISDGAISWMCPVPYLLEKCIPALRAGAETLHRPAPPVVAHVQVAISTDRPKVAEAARQRVDRYGRQPFYANMFKGAGMPVSAEGKGSDALAEALMISGDEAAVKKRLSDLLAAGLDELLITLVPIGDEESERKQLLHLIGSL